MTTIQGFAWFIKHKKSELANAEDFWTLVDLNLPPPDRMKAVVQIKWSGSHFIQHAFKTKQFSKGNLDEGANSSA